MIYEINIKLSSGDKITKGRLNRMCKYFKNKNVYIRYEYNNSLGMHNVREYTGKYDSFKIQESKMSYDCYYNIIFYNKNEWIFEQSFYSHATFTGLGKIQECNSGPYCYFSIEKVDNIIDKLFKIFKK